MSSTVEFVKLLHRDFTELVNIKNLYVINLSPEIKDFYINLVSEYSKVVDACNRYLENFNLFELISVLRKGGFYDEAIHFKKFCLTDPNVLQEISRAEQEYRQYQSEGIC